MPKRNRISKNEKWSSTVGAEDRIFKHFHLWQRCCILPGTAHTEEEEFQEAWSWLVQLQSGNFACKCCSYVENQKLTKISRTNTLSSPTGLAPSKWMRLQSFRQHAQMPKHKKAAILFVRATMKDIPLQSIPSASEDFVHLLKTIKDREMKKEGGLWRQVQAAKDAVLPRRSEQASQTTSIHHSVSGVHDARWCRFKIIRLVCPVHQRH